ncbi:MAG: S26 family signal peptidase [Rhodoglobus sp.]
MSPPLNVILWAVAIVVAVALLALVSLIVVRRRWAVVTVVGGSMLPALREGDVMLARRRKPHGARVGDIVIIESPGEDGHWAASPSRGPIAAHRWLVKRVAAVAGDPRPQRISGVGPVPPRSLMVLGDNGGLDSRMFGAVPDERVLAVVIRVIKRGQSDRDYVVQDDLDDDPLIEIYAELLRRPAGGE